MTKHAPKEQIKVPHGWSQRASLRASVVDIIAQIAWSPDGQMIAAPPYKDDKAIAIWNVPSGEVQMSLNSGKHVNSVAWAPNSRMLASAGGDGAVCLWDVVNGGRIRTIQKRSSFGADHVAWSPDGSLIAAGGGKTAWLSVWDAKTGTRRVSLDAHSRSERGSNVCVAWSPAGDVLASAGSDQTVCLWDSRTFELIAEMRTAFNHAYNIAWTPNGDALAISCHNNNVVIWERGTSEIFVLEGHVSSVASVTFSFDGALLCSNSCDGKVTVWDRHKRQPIASFEERAPGFDKFGRIAFHPTAPILATLGEDDRVIRVWDLRFDEIGRARPLRKSVRYTSAKIVLVGESNVGKSCLAMRLAEDRYPDDHEHGTTHGMRFWPMEAEKLHPAAKPPDGQRRDVVLWDFGGQDEYQLVHQMFLHDTTLALVLIDPTRGRAAMDEARDWNKRLEKHLGKDRAVKLLVGAKVDKRRNLIDQNSIDALCKECRFTAFLDLSAKTGRNTRRLRKLISDALDWDRMAKTSRPELFQGIRDDIEARRKKGEVVVLLDTLTKQFEEAAVDRTKLDGAHTPESIDHLLVDAERAVVAVSDQLATQGVIVKTKLMTGEEALVLRLEVIERYAGSLIIAARNNPRGVPVLEERLLGSTKTIPLPGMTKKERLGPAKERMVLECIVELMIQHGICFRHGGLLVFPTLFPASGTVDEKLPHSISLYYDFTGAIDNIYASLVSKLMVSEEFGEGRLRAGRVEFERGRQGICVLRQIKRAGGLAHVDLFFSENTKPDRKDLFTRFVEEHLRTHGVDIREHQAIKCKCGFEISESIIEENIVRGESDVICPVCRKTTAIGEGVDRIRQRNPETDAKMVALRKTIDKKVAEDIKSAKKAVAGEIRMAKSGDPIRILHLSDLHFTDKTNPETKLGLLLQDIRQQDEHYAAIETVEYLVISGDMTDKGKDAGFEKARQFVAALVEELGLSFQRSIFVPGNHDVQDRADAYEERETEDGSTIKVRHPDNFPKRFEQFSNGFFHPLLQRSYPLNYAEQGISYLFPETGIQFLTLNSAWEIDKNGRKKAGIQPDAVAGVIARADDERKRAVERDDLKKTQPILRIGVWHHAVAGPELMQDLGFLTQLQKAGMKLCLHGDVHESRTELFGYRRPGIEVEILGAGSFGSAAEGRPESTPRLYNMLEVTIDPKTMKHTSIRVHTREQKKENESWQGCHAWTNPKGGRLPFFDIQL